MPDKKYPDKNTSSIFKGTEFMMKKKELTRRECFAKKYDVVSKFFKDFDPIKNDDKDAIFLHKILFEIYIYMLHI